LAIEVTSITCAAELISSYLKSKPPYSRSRPNQHFSWFWRPVCVEYAPVIPGLTDRGCHSALAEWFGELAYPAACAGLSDSPAIDAMAIRRRRIARCHFKDSSVDEEWTPMAM
jgi:hypothetical protein